MPTRARGTGQPLLVVDLESRGGASGVLEWHARRMARAKGDDRLRRVLLHQPDGIGPRPAWPAGARVIRTLDALSPSRRRDIHERVFARSLEIVHGAIGKVFPDVCGVGLGDLNLAMIQDYLDSFSVLSSALGDLLDGGEVGACHIVSADVGFSRALERQVAGRAAAVSTWPSWRLLEAARHAKAKWLGRRSRDRRKAEQTTRDAMAALFRQNELAHARPRVLIVSHSTPHAEMFGVVEGALARVGLGSVVRLDFSGAPTRVENTPAVVCRCGAPGALGRRAGPFGAQWGDAQRELRGVAAFDGSQEALLWEGIAGYLYVSVFDAQARHLWAVDTALELLQPDMVLLGNDRWWGGQAFAQLARRRGIPSMCLQDGVAGDVPSWWWMTADRLAATSEHLVQMLVRHGVAPERCRVTGQPRFDVVTRSGPEDQRAERASVGLDSTAFSVLFAVQPMHGPDYVGSVVAALLAVPGIHVMLRPHPSDPRNVCERILRKHGSARMTLHRSGDSLTLVRACDALVTQNSTVILEAALLGKPVIRAEFGGLNAAAYVAAPGIATLVSGVEELTREVQRLASARHAPAPKASRSEQAALDAYLGPVDGRAGERVAELIAELLDHALRSAAVTP